MSSAETHIRTDAQDLAARSGGFAVVGAIGFVVEAAILAALVALGWAPLAARLVSFPTAVATTWLLNRGWVYADRRSHGTKREAALYLAVQATGFATNLLVFALALSVMALEGPIAALIALVLGSAAGLVVNFSGAHWIVFPKSSGEASAGASLSGARGGALGAAGGAAPSNTAFLVAFLCAFALLLAAPLLNGGPFLFIDTVGYFRYSENLITKLFGVSHLFFWETAEAASAAAREATGGAAEAAAASAPRPIMSGRSIYYGLTAYLPVRAIGIWGGIAVQTAALALCLTFTVFNFLGSFLGSRAGVASLAAIVALLALLTPISIFSGYLMPDVYTGVLLLTIANIAAFWPKMSLTQRLFWAAVGALAVISHHSHILIAFVGGVSLLALAAFARTGVRPAQGLLVCAMAIAGGVGEVAFSTLTEQTLKRPVIRMPALMARSIADGPGYELLKEECPEERYVICPRLSQLPVHVDHFIWSKEPGLGVFHFLSDAEKVRLSEAQFGFLLEATARRPLTQIAASTANATEQLFTVGVKEQAIPERFRTEYDLFFLGADLDIVQGTMAYRNEIPVNLLSPLYFCVYLAALALVIGALAAPQVRRRLGLSGILFVLILLGGMAMNAAVTGALSTPHDRYQARIAWAPPLALMLIGTAMLAARREHEAEAEPPRQA